MENENEIYQAILKIKNYCKDRRCVSCNLFSALNEECIMYGYPVDWETDDIPSNIVEENNE